MKFVGGLGIALIIGAMLRQSVTEDVNEYYWAVEAGDDLPSESEVVLAADGLGPGAHCADYAAEPNPDDPDEGLWTYAYEGSPTKFRCKWRWDATNGFVEAYFDEQQCFA